MDHDKKRSEMIEFQLKSRGIEDKNVINAIQKVPRHEFVPAQLSDISYGDFPLPIGKEQTISQPYIVALMTQELELRGTEKVLEIGTGSGYQAAVLAEISKDVYTIERIDSLSKKADVLTRRLGYKNIHFFTGDGSTGLEEYAPYDAIIVTASCPNVPDSLKSQLSDGGRMVIPVGDKESQVLLKVTRSGSNFHERKICSCIFVPLIGKEGWKK